MSDIFFPSFPTLGLLLIYVAHLMLGPGTGDTANLSTTSFGFGQFSSINCLSRLFILRYKAFFLSFFPKRIDTAMLSGLLPGEECPCCSFIAMTAIGTFAASQSLGSGSRG